MTPRLGADGPDWSSGTTVSSSPAVQSLPSDVSPWDGKNLLSLGKPWERAQLLHRLAYELGTDGGGIRGYWSLLVLERLMAYIGEEEERMHDEAEGTEERSHAENESGNTYSSFHPLLYPESLSQYTIICGKGSNNASDRMHALRKLPPARRYLPCHYFDLICGSSTGA